MKDQRDQVLGARRDIEDVQFGCQRHVDLVLRSLSIFLCITRLVQALGRRGQLAREYHRTGREK